MMKYHRLVGTKGKISRVALNPERNLLFCEFPSATYEYPRTDAVQTFTDLQNVKPYAASLTEEEIAEVQKLTAWTIGSEGSYCIKCIVGRPGAYNPNRKLTDEEADAVWSGMAEARAVGEGDPDVPQTHDAVSHEASGYPF